MKNYNKLLIHAFIIIYSVILISSCDKIDDLFGNKKNLNPYEWAPTNIQIENLSITSKKISWSYGNHDIDGFIIERKIQNENWKELTKTIDINFVDNSYPLDTEIHYSICAYSGLHRSANINIETDTKIPHVEELTKASDSLNTITLSWKYNFTDHSGFLIDRKINDGNWEIEYAQFNSHQLTFTDEDVDFKNNDYFYRVYAYLVQYKSDYSNIEIHTPQIGEKYGGGIVFYLFSGLGGLICAEKDFTTRLDWGCRPLKIYETKTNIGTGAENTAAIINACDESKYAAKTCNNFKLNNKTDWYLPSKDELQLMYQELHLIGLGNFTTNGYYWSSSEYFYDEWAIAWSLNFRDGASHTSSKSASWNVRAIRTF